jgi:hypothetical protein
MVIGMSGRDRAAIAVAVIAAGVGGGLLARSLATRTERISLTGAVMLQDEDARNQSPIEDVTISAPDEAPAVSSVSRSSGFFTLKLSPEIVPGQSVALTFRHPDYQPLDLTVTAGDGLIIARLLPIHHAITAQPRGPDITVANVRVRYSVEARSAVNIGTGVKTFQVVNIGNVPCADHSPCSPDRKWKAAVESVSLDAGEENEFRNARVACIAGPCSFTHVDSDKFSKGGRTIGASIRNWSDTTTFVLQAEVFHPEMRDTVQQSYPIIIGRAVNFTLPPDAEGLSLEAEINGTEIVFPMGPSPSLSWANCDVRAEQDRKRLFRCELKSGYQFP